MARRGLELNICTKVGVGGMQTHRRHGGAERDLEGKVSIIQVSPCPLLPSPAQTRPSLSFTRFYSFLVTCSEPQSSLIL